MKVEAVTFTGSDGQRLAARLDGPDEAPVAYALFAHCFTCGKNVFAAARIVFSSNVADLVAAAAHLRRAYQAPALLIGHSLGGAAVLAAALEVPDSKAVVTIAAPSDPRHVTGLFAERVPEIEAQGEAEVRLAGRAFKIKRQFLADVAEQNLAARIARLRQALLVMHSPRDTTVDIGNATRIFMAARHPKSFVSLDRADHLLSARADAMYAASVIAAWAQPYIGRV